MKRQVDIQGMTCGHCKARVEKALRALPNTAAEVDLENNLAVVEGDVPDSEIRAAVEDAGYTVLSIAVLQPEVQR